MAFALEEEGLNELFNMGYIYESKSTLYIDKELMLVTEEEVDIRIKNIFRYLDFVLNDFGEHFFYINNFNQLLLVITFQFR